VSNETDRLIEAVKADPEARRRLAEALAADMERRLEPRGFARWRPFLAGLSSGLVVLLAFLVPSIQDQWDRYEARKAVTRYAEVGHSLMQTAQYASAEKAFARALELAGNQRLDLLEARIKARVMRVYEDPTWRGAVPEDIEESDFAYLLQIENAARRPKERSTTLAAYGSWLAGEQRWPEAEQQLREAIRLDPKAAGPHVHLGNVLDDTGRPHDAEAEYRIAIQLDPKDAGAHYNLGLLLEDSGRQSLAEVEMRRYTELAPADPDGWVRLSEVLRALGKNREALAAAQAALRLDPANEDAKGIVEASPSAPVVPEAGGGRGEVTQL